MGSCKKGKQDKNNNDYYISAKLDGVQKNFYLDALAVHIQSDTISLIGIAAFSAENSKERLRLLVGLPDQAITTGTYIDINRTDSVAQGEYSANYTDTSKVYFAGFQVDTNPRLHVTISTLTDSIIRGTFYGTFYQSNGRGPAFISFTEGKFYMPIH